MAQGKYYDYSLNDLSENTDPCQLLDLKHAESIMESFCISAGVAGSIFDLQGHPLLKVNWSKICTDFFRKYPKSVVNCRDNDKHSEDDFIEGKQFAICKCRNGLMNFTTPIVAGGIHIANASISQFLVEEPDMEFFSELADRFSFDKDAFIKDLQKLTIVSDDELENIQNFLRNFSSIVVREDSDTINKLKTRFTFKEGTDRFKTIFESISDCVFVWDKFGSLLYANKAAEKGFHFSRAKILGKPLNETGLALPGGPGLWQDRIQAVVKLCKTIRGEDHINTKSGEKFSESVISPVEKKNGEVVAVSCVYRDVTKRRKAEIDFAESRNLMRMVLDAIPSRVFWKDEELRYLGCNKLFASDAGLANPEEIVGKSDYDLPWGKKEAENYRQDDSNVIKNRKGRIHFDESQTTPDGKTIWLRTSKIPLKDTNRRIIGVMGAYDDITDKKEAEDSLEKRAEELASRNTELQQKNAELDEFTYIASHDLQEPLRKISAFSDMLMFDLEGKLDDESEENLRFLTDAAKRMQKLVQALLDLSRSGRREMKMQEFDLNECINDAIYALEFRINETTAQIKHAELPRIVGDKLLLTQLYQNLIGNALKFRGKDIPLIIEITRNEENGETVFGVKDNGIGLKQEYAEQIFAPFKRLHGRATYEGTGIGLAICRKIVERHNGKIHVESELGKGSWFKFTLS